MLMPLSTEAGLRERGHRARVRRGFALMFVLMTIVVLLIGAAAIYSNITSAQDVVRQQRAAQVLARLVNELGKSGQNPSFAGDIGTFPGKISHLVIPITVGQFNDCGNAYTGGGSTGQVGRWVGPYHLIPTQTDSPYTIVAGFVAEDTLHRIPGVAANGSDPGTLNIVMKNVALSDAQALGMAVDGVTTGAGPTIKFTPNGNSAVTVFYAKAITGC